MTCRSISTSAAAPVADAVDVRVKDPQCSRGFTYTMYEANAWQLKFAKSGKKNVLVTLNNTPCIIISHYHFFYNVVL